MPTAKMYKHKILFESVGGMLSALICTASWIIVASTFIGMQDFMALIFTIDTVWWFIYFLYFLEISSNSLPIHLFYLLKFFFSKK